ncbi:hypothetical protein ACFOG5_06050 [Pedobacter fastidiosus]|uniref:Uncharacterized protein n=1 Tax=Pedobacter fastidiosus TaxID=2765361 RepID=A0ABR7KQC6_9SPHI|nr:hypothetical protein [Pedobacter fastidiosus]MBC6110298.1 hypothetical protein [Pedobacter fastidiosus]
MIIFSSEPTSRRNWDWVIRQYKIDEIDKRIDVISLKTFLEKLNKPGFVAGINNVNLIMLLLSENGQKFEKYPITIGTDLSDPRDLNIPEQKPVKN